MGPFSHDVHHVVSGFGTEPAGETGVLSITASQIGFPAYVLLTTAGQLGRFRLQVELFPLLSRAVAQGGAIARGAPCLAAVRLGTGSAAGVDGVITKASLPGALPGAFPPLPFPALAVPLLAALQFAVLLPVPSCSPPGSRDPAPPGSCPGPKAEPR